MGDTKIIKNVLVLTMSTLSFKRSSNEEKLPLLLNYYKYNDISVNGYGQLEPIPKMLIKKLSKINERLDKIIVLASNEAMKQVSFEIKMPNDEIVSMCESATSFFERQIHNEDSNIEIEVIEVSKDDDKLMEPIQKTVNELRSLKKKNRDLTLFLDMHGGQRQNQLIMDAIISLLKIEEISVAETYSCDGFSNDIENPREISDANEALKIFDFVAGMNEFINYGSSKSLEKYIPENESGNEDLIKCILGVSNALKLCDIDGFERNLDKLQNILMENSVDGYMDIFREAIAADYTENLLDTHKRNLITELEWALNKGFIQQCLAIVESKSAELFVKLFIKEESGVIFDTISKENQPLDVFYKAVKKPHEKHKDSVFMNFILSCVTKPGQSYVKVYERDLCVNCSFNFKTDDKKNKAQYRFRVKFKYKNIEKEDIKYILELWAAIKKIRNLIMHSTGLTITNKNEIEFVNGILASCDDKKILKEIQYSWDEKREVSAGIIEYMLKQYVDTWKRVMDTMAENNVNIYKRISLDSNDVLGRVFLAK